VTPTGNGSEGPIGSQGTVFTTVKLMTQSPKSGTFATAVKEGVGHASARLILGARSAFIVTVQTPEETESQPVQVTAPAAEVLSRAAVPAASVGRTLLPQGPGVLIVKIGPGQLTA